MTVKPRERPADDDDDPVENMLKKTGCIELHYKVQECIATTKDWRKCQTEVNEFRSCISKHKQEEMAKAKS
ncbi:cytochrome c oxidase assembly factor 4 homolog, mitochondrial isoform X2 [Ostrinia furnacalis]|uniref:cytochrome c oxidase assembly factor 4 homolog, mitochondrial isoform X1 n=1 Tax=Ostrinia furnacalis TaxID=93504 RepID=UPI00103D9698|nr:cytochrome c oxidase assembly factor 4 homolog, mitochondrial isoform X1 [Ostrinia furnacalis]XP_028162331.1 cytochrome c oxidase assembly factor 4 homolog, mitochondrial isoform X2 [Ostrinia furnacalis]